MSSSNTCSTSCNQLTTSFNINQSTTESTSVTDSCSTCPCDNLNTNNPVGFTFSTDTSVGGRTTLSDRCSQSNSGFQGMPVPSTY